MDRPHHKFRQHADTVAAREAAKPKTSWWMDTERFYELARHRAPIMRHSQFHHMGLSIDSAVGWVENRGIERKRRDR